MGANKKLKDGGELLFNDTDLLGLADGAKQPLVPSDPEATKADPPQPPFRAAAAAPPRVKKPKLARKNTSPMRRRQNPKKLPSRRINQSICRLRNRFSARRAMG
jgi:hypothetical protein